MSQSPRYLNGGFLWAPMFSISLVMMKNVYFGAPSCILTFSLSSMIIRWKHTSNYPIINATLDVLWWATKTISVVKLGGTEPLTTIAELVVVWTYLCSRILSIPLRLVTSLPNLAKQKWTSVEPKTGNRLQEKTFRHVPCVFLTTKHVCPSNLWAVAPSDENLTLKQGPRMLYSDAFSSYLLMWSGSLTLCTVEDGKWCPSSSQLKLPKYTRNHLTSEALL